ncbi:hypothetical protein J5N97_022814 [Dioscorea zingiberensis]|uniref:Glabrous enhancer-binding protein-like DBD domain-containing protein n=1 Tax=Dioscorea zingiberensis TaxID=325984 RepID=A0A9D5CB62_9LILI|nr:hypothetical protein J5N97_022814 [Dioscorea zingiberensis]
MPLITVLVVAATNDGTTLVVLLSPPWLIDGLIAIANNGATLVVLLPSPPLIAVLVAASNDGATLVVLLPSPPLIVVLVVAANDGATLVVLLPSSPPIAYLVDAANDGATLVEPWTEDHNEILLQGALDFRQRTGHPPKLSAMEEFLNTIRPSLPSNVTPQQLHNKLRHIRRRLYSSNKSQSAPLPPRLSKLACLLFNSANSQKNEEKDDDDVDDQSVDDYTVCYPYLLEVLQQYNKDGKIVKMFEIGIEKKLLDVNKLVALESQFKKLAVEELELSLKAIQLDKEILALLLDALERSK